jgi:tight adherence protein C
MTLFLISVGIGLAILIFVTVLIFVRPSRQSELLADVTNQAYQPTVGTLKPGGVDKESLLRPLGVIQQLFGGTSNPDIVRRLMLAGYRKPSHVDAFLAARLVLPAVSGLLVAYFLKDNVIIMFILAVLLGFFFPDFWLTYAINQRRERIQRSLPDTLDLLTICMEAGLGLDQSIVRVGTELELAHPDLSQELLQINLEQRAGNPRIGAWRNMADRVGLESVRSFVNMLVQTERFGTPISRALGVFSEALRTQRRQKAEERAAKTTIKLVFPLVLFIFPSIFVVTAAPAVISLMDSFSKMFK